MRKIYFITLAMLTVGCGKLLGPTYRIGVDPTWFPVDLKGKEVNVFAFTNDLLTEIAKREDIEFKRVTMSWDNLLWGLKEERYDAMLSSLYPYVFNLDKYDFSDPFLNTGPVLITAKDSDLDSIEDIGEKEIGVTAVEEEAMLIAHEPEVIVRYYDSVTDGLSKVVNGELDGVLVGMIPAISFINDLYSEQLRIVSEPLSAEGLRLVTLHGEEKKLIKRFNHAIEKLKDDGTYMELAEKWSLNK